MPVPQSPRRYIKHLLPELEASTSRTPDLCPLFLSSRLKTDLVVCQNLAVVRAQLDPYLSHAYIPETNELRMYSAHIIVVYRTYSPMVPPVKHRIKDKDKEAMAYFVQGHQSSQNSNPWSLEIPLSLDIKWTSPWSFGRAES
jgi:hypothetical protein